MLTLAKYSIGIGDRFAHQAKAQLQGCIQMRNTGTTIIPVWNKSNREHNIVGSQPESVRSAADAAVAALGWTDAYHVDADHIQLETVDRFLSSSDFYTIDVADFIGVPCDPRHVVSFTEMHDELVGEVTIPGIDAPFHTTRTYVEEVASKYLTAVTEASHIYRHITGTLGEGNFIPEISMDETDAPQTPMELLIILAAISDKWIPIQTIAPKFSGRFNKGVDYVGDVAQFEKEFNDDLAVIAYALHEFDLPANLKLSVHSGSDKFSIYEPMRAALLRTGAGLHVKTAGTTWLEELIGLAEAGGDGLVAAGQIYAAAYGHRSELCAPYASVIDIDPEALPDPATVQAWTSAQYVNALRHDGACPEYNSSFRQLLHVGYKVAAQAGEHYIKLLNTYEDSVSRNVTFNLFERHLKPLFSGLSNA